VDREHWGRKISHYKRLNGGKGKELPLAAVSSINSLTKPDGARSSGHGFTLSPDKPLIDPKDDQLGYALFARHLATSLTKMVPADGFVVAIYGPWGSGKTTLLNFLFHYFQQAIPEEQPIIVQIGRAHV
jgi:polynucleotide 5'-kinase involved in rRNA processing